MGGDYAELGKRGGKTGKRLADHSPPAITSDRSTESLTSFAASLFPLFLASSSPSPPGQSLVGSTLLFESASLVLFSSNIGEVYELSSHPDALLV